MTVSINGAEVATAIEVASWAGSLVAMLVIGLLIYLMVRPSRRRQMRTREAEPTETEEMLRLMARMERRLEVLERLVAGQAQERDRVVEAGVERPETRRTK